MDGQIDATRFNRKERRKIGKNVHAKIPGRNLPYEQKLHHSWPAYNAKRAQELADEHRPTEKTS